MSCNETIIPESHDSAFVNECAPSVEQPRYVLFTTARQKWTSQVLDEYQGVALSMADWEPLQAQAGIRRRLQRTMRAFWCSSMMPPGAASEASKSKATRLSHEIHIRSSGRLRSQTCHILVGNA